MLWILEMWFVGSGCIVAAIEGAEAPMEIVAGWWCWIGFEETVDVRYDHQSTTSWLQHSEADVW